MPPGGKADGEARVMDILAHTLWVGAAAALASRHRALSRATVVGALGLAALPDLLHLVPILVWWLAGDGSLAVLRAYAVALPGQEPGMPAWVQFWSHHLHCVIHSAPVAVLVGGVLWFVRRAALMALLGWASHIVIDVFTHSADYFPVAVFYPFTDRGFDGIAWTSPWFMALNYGSLAAFWAWLAASRGRFGGR